jgi:hypothetical protein
MITLKEVDWEEVLQRIKEDYADRPSVYLMRSKMREELGFVPRWHEQWVNNKDKQGKELPHGRYVKSVCLDFYNEAMETFFRMKYL